MTKPRTGSMKERSPGRWKLQVTADPDPVTGERRRLSRTIEGTSRDAREALQLMVVHAGAGLYGGGRITVGDLLDQFLSWATTCSPAGDHATIRSSGASGA